MLKYVQLYGTLGLHRTMTRWKTQGVIKYSVICIPRYCLEFSRGSIQDFCFLFFIFSESPWYKVSWESVHWKPSYPMWSDRQKDGQTWQSQYSLSATFRTRLKMTGVISLPVLCAFKSCTEIHFFSPKFLCYKAFFQASRASINAMSNPIAFGVIYDHNDVNNISKDVSIWIDSWGKLFMHVYMGLITTFCNIPHHYHCKFMLN